MSAEANPSPTAEPARATATQHTAALRRLVPLAAGSAALLITALVGALSGIASTALALGFAALLAAIAVLWISVQLLLGEQVSLIEFADEHGTPDGENDPLLERKRAALAALSDMDRERQLGKIEQADYDDVVQPLRDEAKLVLRELDRRAAPHRERAEQLIADHLRARDVAQKPSANNEQKQTDNMRPKCSACQTENDADARFCKACAKPLRTADEERSDG